MPDAVTLGWLLQASALLLLAPAFWMTYHDREHGAVLVWRFGACLYVLGIVGVFA